MVRRLLCLCGWLWAMAAATAEVVRAEGGALLYRQGDGVVVSLPQRPQRTVIVYASLARIWYAAGGTAVGVPSVRSGEVLPEAARAVPEIGRMNMPSAEHILLLRPDLVLLSGHLPRHRELAAMLRQAGVAALCCDYRNYADYALLFDLFCRLNGGSPPPEAERMAAAIEALCARTRALPPVRVAILFAAQSGLALETAGSNTGHMVERLGGHNVIRSPATGKIRFSYERFLLENPDVIVVVPMGDLSALQEKVAEELMRQPAWQSLAAVRAGRVHYLPAAWFLYQAGPEYLQAFRYLAGVLYPGLEGSE